MRYYKFLSPSYLNVIALSNFQLIFGRFCRFNDIFEGHVTFSYQSEQDKEAYQNKQKEYEDKINRIRIYSLASSDEENYIENSHLMWAHYADGHKGFCIEFNEGILSNYPLCKTGKANTSIKVEYPDKLKYEELTINEEGQLIESIDYVLAKVISTKHKLWEYEQEVRLISKVKDIHPFSPTAINAIYFGVKMEEPIKTELLNIARRHKVKCFEMHKNDKDVYKLIKIKKS